MRLSVHNPVRGGFDYYESPDTVAINDDHPTPNLASKRTKIGVPASVAGRPLPSEAKLVGRGDVPIGSISSGQRGSWTSTVASAMPSGIGGFSLPPFEARELVALGTALGAVANMATGSQSWPRGAVFALIGGGIGFAISKRIRGV